MLRFNQLLTTTFAVLLALLAACADEASNVSTRTSEGGAPNQAARKAVSSFAQADNVEKTDGYVTAEELARLKSMLLARDEYLEQLIEDKAAMLAANDESLRQRVIALETKFIVLDKLVNEDLGQLKEQVSGLHNQLNAVRSDLENTENRLLEAIEANDKALARELKRKIKRLRREISANSDAIAANAQLISDLGAQIRATDHYVREAVLALGKRITNIDERLNLQDAKFQDLVHGLTDRINGLDQRVARLDRELADVRADFKQHISTFEKELGQDIQEIRQLVITTNAANLNRFSQLETKLAGIHHHVERYEIYAQSMRTNLSALMQRVTKNEEVFATHQHQMKEAKKHFLAIVAAEQDARTALTNQVTNLVSRVEELALSTQQALDLSRANRTAYKHIRAQLNQEVTGLHQRLTGVERSFAKELAAVKNSLTTQLTRLEEQANQMAATLGKDMQERFAGLTIRVAELENRQLALPNAIFAELAKVVTDYTNLSRLMEADTEGLVDASYRSIDSLGDVQREFINAVEPVLQNHGVDWQQINNRFTTQLDACVANMDSNGGMTTIGGKESFLFLADAYVNFLVTGVRSGNHNVDSIFYGLRPDASNGTINGYLVAGMIPAKDGQLAPNCGDQLQNLMHELIFGDSEESRSIRKALMKWTLMDGAVARAKSDLDRLAGASEDFDNVLRRYLGQYLDADALIEFLLHGKGDSVPFYARAAQLVLAAATDRLSLHDNRAEMNRLIAVISRVRTLEAQVSGNGARIAEMQTEIDALKASIEQIAQTTNQEIAKLSSSLATSFKLIASLAGALGFEEIMLAAAREAKQLDDAFDLSEFTRPSQCISLSHSYLHALPRENNAWRCQGNTALADDGLSEKEASKCAIHSNRSSTKYTWGNLSEGGLGWSFSHHKGVGNGLALKMYDPDRPDHQRRELELAQRSEGPVHPDRESSLVFHVTGHTAYGWKLDAKSVRRKNHYEFSKTVVGSDVLVENEGTSWRYDIPFNSAIGHLGSCHWDRYITLTPVDKFGAASGGSCTTRIHTFSPVVLDFSGHATLRTINPLLSRTRFDLDANGIPDQTGWIPRGKVGFLALDLNENGKIDDGSELFGQATRVGLANQPASNGYTALKHYDLNQDGVIDANDGIFDDLLVWFDGDEDGVSAATELRRLSLTGVTKIAVAHEQLPDAFARDFHGLAEGNLIKYQSRFWGPKPCGKQGCKSYDVFFGAHETVRTAATQ